MRPELKAVPVLKDGDGGGDDPRRVPVSWVFNDRTKRGIRYYIVAHCNDDTFWEYDSDTNEWLRLPDIPQEE